MSERWPALMTKETAAAYCDMTAEQFDRQCPVQAVDQGWRGLRWKKTKLDAWIEALPERPRARKAAPEIGLDEPKFAAANEQGCATDPPLSAEARRAEALARIG